MAQAAEKQGYDYNIYENAPLGAKGWFQTGGTAKKLVRIPSEQALLAYLTDHRDEDIHVFGILSNTIIRDGGLSATVIRLGRDFARLKIIDSTTFYAGAMVLDKNLARFAALNGVSGLEFYSGIPGTIGGALRMNAGCYGTETKDVLIEAYGIDRKGISHTFSPQDLKMAYRHSEIPKGVIMTGALFHGERGDSKKALEVIESFQQRRQETQPIREKTGGSTFANPSLEELEIAELPADTKTWQLIDKAGGRGLKIGGAQMSSKHCNFMINTGHASAADLEALGEEIRRRVYEMSGITLRWEIKRIGEHQCQKQ